MNTTTQTRTSIRLPAKSLKDVLTVFRKVVARKPPVPELGAVFFDQGMLRVTNLDQEIRWRGRIPHDFRMAVVFRELAEAVKTAKARDYITIRPDPETETLAIVEHSTAESRIGRLDDDRILPLGREDVLVGESVVFDQLDQVMPEILPFASTDETRYILNGVYFDRRGALVATNGRVLLRIPSSSCSRLSHSAIMPSQTCALFKDKRLRDRPVGLQLIHPAPNREETDPKDLEPRAAKLTLGDGEWEIWTKLVEGKYPNYLQVIPKKEQPWLGFLQEPEAERLIEFAKALPKGKDAPMEQTSVHIKVSGGEMDVWCEQPCRKTKISGIMTASKNEVQMCFHRAFILNVLEARCFRWELSDSCDPLYAVGPDRRDCVVMPLRTA